MKLIPARCPSCGADIEVNRDYETTKCKYCDTKVIIDDAIAKYKIEIENMPTAKSYLKLGARNLEHGELTKAQELLEKALEINPDSPETIIKENLSKVLQHQLTEKEFDKVLYSFKDASKFCSSEKLDELIMYSVKLLDKERMETFEYVSGRIPKTIFVKRVELFLLFLSFYERVYRNNITEVDNKIFMIKKIFACIQCYRNAHIDKHDSVNYTIPAEKAKFLLKKEEQYKEELAKLDENYEKKKKELEEEQKRIREEQERKEKEEKEAKEKAARERLKKAKENQKKQADIICSVIDLFISIPALFCELLFLLVYIVEFSPISIVLILLTIIMSVPVIIIKAILNKINISKIIINVFAFIRYIPVFVLLVLSCITSPYMTASVYEGYSYVNEEANETITIKEGKLSINNAETYEYTSSSEEGEYILTLKDEKDTKYKYNNETKILCLLDKEEKCIKSYKQKDAE